MEYRVLGPLELRDGYESLPLAGAKQRALLALLLLHANRVVSRDRLIDELWGDHPPDTAVQSVQVYVSRLRKLLPDDTLLTRPPGYLLHIDRDTLDLHRFERLLADGQKALAAHDADRAAALLRDALELWRGPALAEFASEPFAQAEIARLDDLRVAAVEARLEADLALGRHADLVGELEALIAEHPHRERLRGQLMLALYRSGRQAEALAAYQHARHALVEELGIEPSAALQRLEKQILTQDEELEPPPQSLRFGASFQSRHRTNLPVPATQFLGREPEVEEVLGLLAQGDVRLLTMTGPGGSGKTRLAVQAAGVAADAFPGGVWWIPLASLRDPTLVLEVAAQVLGSTSDLAAHIGDERMLLLLDNFEQVVAAAPDVALLLEQCPQLTVLVTSREVLRVDGEWVYAVDPLRDAEAVVLFDARARAARRDFVVTDDVQRVCARLDNLPLAIELAAARVTVLSPAALLERLERGLPMLIGGARDAPERQRTLRATIEWSHDLLAPGEQVLFAGLAVFSGGCTLEAAEEIADADLDAIASLVDKSLVRQMDVRFSMLETIREYSVERLEESGAAEELRRRHAEHFVALAERAEPELEAAEQAQWHERLERDHENLRSAIEWTRAAGRLDLQLRFAAALWRFWHVRGYYREALRELQQALGNAAGDDELRTKVLSGLVVCASRTGDLDRAEAWAEEALRESEASRDELAIADALNALAAVAAEREDVGRAVELAERALDHARKGGDPLVIAKLVGNIGRNLVASDATSERGLALLQDALQRFGAIGDRASEAMILWAIGHAALTHGDPVEGRRCLEQSLRIAQELRFTHPMPGILLWMARIFSNEGNDRQAVLLVGAAQSVVTETGKTLDREERERLEATLSDVTRRLSEDEVAALLEKGHRLTQDEAVALALDASP